MSPVNYSDSDSESLAIRNAAYQHDRHADKRRYRHNCHADSLSLFLGSFIILKAIKDL